MAGFATNPLTELNDRINVAEKELQQTKAELDAEGCTRQDVLKLTQTLQERLLELEKEKRILLAAVLKAEGECRAANAEAPGRFSEPCLLVLQSAGQPAAMQLVSAPAKAWEQSLPCMSAAGGPSGMAQGFAHRRLDLSETASCSIPWRLSTFCD